jgi:hypothetical protein
VDTAKYTGDIKSAPLIKLPKDPEAEGEEDIELWAVEMTEFSVTNEQGDARKLASGSAWPANATSPMIAWIDSGSTLTTMSGDLIREVGKEFDVDVWAPDADVELVMIECKYEDAKVAKGRKVTFEFGSATSIAVPVEQLVFKFTDEQKGLLKTSGLPFDVDKTCLFGLQSMIIGSWIRLEDNIAVLGHNILRSSYTVFDMKNKAIGIAPVSHSGKSNVVELKADGTEYPKGTGDAGKTTPTELFMRLLTPY